MKYFFSFFLAFFLFSCFGVLPSDASGKAHVKIGEEFSISATTRLKSPEISWTLLQGDAILEKKTGKKYSHVFTDLGEFLINVTAKSGNETETTTIFVEVSTNAPTFSKSGAIIETLPARTEGDGKIHLSGPRAEVAFFFSKSTGSIKQYAFDGDIFSDADGNGTIDDDIENKGDPSFFTGSAFSKVYENKGVPIRARLTVTDTAGIAHDDFVDIVFDAGNSIAERKTKPLQAILQTLPPADDSGIIHLTGDSGEVTFLSNMSEGDIVEYRIDKNTMLDSNKDGKPANDVDNLSDHSFSSGQPWRTAFQKSDTPVTVQLLVVGKNGKGSIVQRQVVFGGDGIKLLPAMVASQNAIVTGEAITFRLFNVPADTKISWDFNGDGVFESENTDSTEMQYRFGEEGEFTVTAVLASLGKKEVTRVNKTITVKTGTSSEITTNAPTAKFTVKKDGGKVLFDSAASAADGQLSNTDLSFSWDFGDGEHTEGPNPSHAYKTVGDYQVVLTVEDSAERRGTYTEAVTISEADIAGNPAGTPGASPSVSPGGETPTGSPDGQGGNGGGTNGDTSSKNDGAIWQGFSLPWWIWLLLFFLLIPFLIIIRKKIEDPDKSFSEIIFPKKETLVESGMAEIVSESLRNDVPVQQGAPDETPEWMRTHDEVKTVTPVVEDEDDIPQRDFSREALPSPAPLDRSDGDVPDWMKGSSDSPFSEDLPDEPGNSSFGQNTGPSVSSAPITEQFDGSDHPEWLDEIKYSGSPISHEDPGPSLSVATPEDSTTVPFAPNWMNDSPAPASEQNFGATAQTLPEDDEALPDWLRTGDSNPSTVNVIQGGEGEEFPLDKGGRGGNEELGIEEDDEKFEEGNIAENDEVRGDENLSDPLAEETEMGNEEDALERDTLSSDDETIPEADNADEDQNLPDWFHPLNNTPQTEGEGLDENSEIPEPESDVLEDESTPAEENQDDEAFLEENSESTLDEEDSENSEDDETSGEENIPENDEESEVTASLVSPEIPAIQTETRENMPYFQKDESGELHHPEVFQTEETGENFSTPATEEEIENLEDENISDPIAAETVPEEENLEIPETEGELGIEEEGGENTETLEGGSVNLDEQENPDSTVEEKNPGNSEDDEPSEAENMVQRDAVLGEENLFAETISSYVAYPEDAENSKMPAIDNIPENTEEVLAADSGLLQTPIFVERPSLPLSAPENEEETPLSEVVVPQAPIPDISSIVPNTAVYSSIPTEEAVREDAQNTNVLPDWLKS
ncbi:MAG: PKD domain-containing protein [Candidatus Peregrinibacteria bacterium]